MTVFDVFVSSPYTFLKISRGGVMGNTITESDPSTGVFKLRDGITTGDNQETFTSSSTLHIRPSESFITAVAGNMVGHGVRKDGQDYSIIGQSAGENYQTGVREHYTVTLERADYSELA